MPPPGPVSERASHHKAHHINNPGDGARAIECVILNVSVLVKLLSTQQMKHDIRRDMERWEWMGLGLKRNLAGRGMAWRG